jgi:hypothetical protein
MNSTLDKETRQLEMEPAKLIKIKKKNYAYKCAKCGKIYHTQVNPNIKNGYLLLSSIIARIIMMKELYILFMKKILDYFDRTLKLKTSIINIDKYLKNFSDHTRSV